MQVYAPIINCNVKVGTIYNEIKKTTKELRPNSFQKAMLIQK